MMKSEEWVIKPSILANISESKKVALESDMRYVHERMHFGMYDISIFDDLRRELIKRESKKIRESELKKIYKL